MTISECLLLSLKIQLKKATVVQNHVDKFAIVKGTCQTTVSSRCLRCSCLRTLLSLTLGSFLAARVKSQLSSSGSLACLFLVVFRLLRLALACLRVLAWRLRLLRPTRLAFLGSLCLLLCRSLAALSLQLRNLVWFLLFFFCIPLGFWNQKSCWPSLSCIMKVKSCSR